MLAYMQQHYHRTMGLADVAAALKMNASYLSALFSATTGVPFCHRLGELRLAKAKDMLRNPTSRACEVAAAVGYTSAAHFGRAFKVHTGLSPGCWRDAQGPLAPAPH